MSMFELQVLSIT